MIGRAKKSFIIDWWVAKRDDKFKFVDITDVRNMPEGSVIVGRTYAPVPEYTTSRNVVVKVNRNGVYTASGRFYPFKLAHPLYLMYLREIHVPTDSIIASKWECIDAKNNVYIADLEYPSGELVKDAVFDFQPVNTDDNVFVGISDVLDDAIVFNSFDRREFTDERTIKGAFPSDVYSLAYELKNLKSEAIKDVRKLLKRKKF